MSDKGPEDGNCKLFCTDIFLHPSIMSLSSIYPQVEFVLNFHLQVAFHSCTRSKHVSFDSVKFNKKSSLLCVRHFHRY